MAFDAFSGTSGRWSYVEVAAGTPDLTTAIIDWTNVTSQTNDQTITSWKLNPVRQSRLQSLTYDSPGNVMGVVFPSQRLSGVGLWGGQLSGICSTDGNFEVGTPIVCDFLFHKGGNVGRHNCRIIISGLEEFTGVTESTARFTVNFDGDGLLPAVTTE